MPARSELHFQAAVERPLSVAFQLPEGTWEAHDYRVEVVTERRGLDEMEVVMDFRHLEAALDAWLAPLQGRLLTEPGLRDPIELARRLLAELAVRVPPPARLVEVALTDGRGRRLSVTSDGAGGER